MTNFDFSNVVNNTTFTSVVDARVTNFNFSNNASIIKLINLNTVSLKNWVSVSLQDIYVQIQDIRQNLLIQGNNITSLKIDVKNVMNRTTINTWEITNQGGDGKHHDIVDIKAQIEALTIKSTRRSRWPGSWTSTRLTQVKNIIISLLSEKSVTVINNVVFNVNNSALTLIDVLNMLVTADGVSVTIQYNDLTLLEYVILTDGAAVRFNPTGLRGAAERRRDLAFEFFTNQWKGLTAKFGGAFARRRSNPYQVCRRSRWIGTSQSRTRTSRSAWSPSGPPRAFG